jgi:hypothetical protein
VLGIVTCNPHKIIIIIIIIIIIMVINCRRVRWTEHVTRIAWMRNGKKILGGKTERKRSFGIPRRRWESITIDLKETGWELVDWIHLDQGTKQ